MLPRDALEIKDSNQRKTSPREPQKVSRNRDEERGRDIKEEIGKSPPGKSIKKFAMGRRPEKQKE